MYGQYPGVAGGPPGVAPPGMGIPVAASAPPGVAPPGVAYGAAPASAYSAAPPGVAYGQTPSAMPAPRNLPSSWQPPANMPNINFNAPVIRMGTGGRSGAQDGGAGGRKDNASGPARRGLGMDRDGDRRDGPQQVIPPTREEIARTIFVGNIPDGVGGDDGMERILETAGKLVRWIRATDASNKPQTFGFAEFGDAQSLETAAEIFKDVRVPTKRQKPGQEKRELSDEEVDTTKLSVMVDDASIKYAEEWSKTRNEDEATVQFRLDTAKDALSQVLASFFNPPKIAVVNDYGGDVIMHDAPEQNGDSADVAFITLAATGEDELADIPEDMREIVAAEIAAFRDRSNQRDRERLRREEELEAEERRRSGRRSSPPPTALGHGGANGIPLGPRAERERIQGAPTGPKGSQFPRDYQDGVNFVNGGSLRDGVYIDREDDDDPASDSELERRRQKKRKDEEDNEYKKELSRWLKHEDRTVSSFERTNHRMKNEQAQKQAARDAQAKQLKDFDDDQEAALGRLIYYRDQGEYMRERQLVREREAKEDAVDRAEEQRELAAQQKKKDHARGEADAFLDQQAEEIMRTQEQRQPASFKISLGAATKKLEQTAAPRPRRTAADVENLLEDENVTEQTGPKKRALIPINFDAAVRANLTQEEIEDAQRQLARDIPNDKEGLWSWPVSWEHLPQRNIDKDIKDWAATKILELMGVQEDMLIDAIVEHLKRRGGAQELVEQLEELLDEEAENLVKKLWRMVIYYSETEKRGIK